MRWANVSSTRPPAEFHPITLEGSDEELYLPVVRATGEGSGQNCAAAAQ